MHTAACFRNDAVTNSKVQLCGECDSILSVLGLSHVCKNSRVDMSSMKEVWVRDDVVFLRALGL